MRLSLLLGVLLVSFPAHAIDIGFVQIGDPSNPCDPQSQGCFGSVDYTYQIGSVEITNSQYVEFLNAVAAVDPNFVYDPGMAHLGSGGGILRSGSPGSYTYSSVPGRESMPVNRINFLRGARFANWLHNGQLIGAQDANTTEDGAYTITQVGIDANSIQRKSDATFFLPSEDEWYKAAYYDAVSMSYLDYPTWSDIPPTCSLPSPGSNLANCDSAVGGPVEVGSYAGSASSYGTFDQGGNVFEVTETASGSQRVFRGGDWLAPASSQSSSIRGGSFQASTHPRQGFRIAMIPEPSTSMLLAGGLLLIGLRATHRSEAKPARRLTRNP